MKRTTSKLSTQMKEKLSKPVETAENKGNFDKVISTGSTLLDLAISGGRIRGGGLPGGILVEIYGQESTGKSALACEISGNIQKAGGQVRYDDPEGRLDSQYAQIYGMHIDKDNYFRSNTVMQVFEHLSKWNPDGDAIHGIIVDSLAALSTEVEIESRDKMGGRKAKELSQELRVAGGMIREKNFLMVCTNQIRDTMSLFGSRQDTSGGWAVKFWSSVRLETSFGKPKMVTKKKKIDGKDYERTVGVNIKIKVVKNSVWNPFKEANVSIIFGYGVDDIKSNLEYLKEEKEYGSFQVGDRKLGLSLDGAITKVEEMGLESELKEEVIEHWNKVEIDSFQINRKPKNR